MVNFKAKIQRLVNNKSLLPLQSYIENKYFQFFLKKKLIPTVCLCK